MRATFVRREWENQARTIASFYFQPDAIYRYEAGQYAVITLLHAGPDKRGTSRTMTLSSSPSDELLQVTMRLFADSGSSFKTALLALRPGDELTIYDAMGDLVLPLDTSIPLVFVAGGVGIASFVGMMQWLLDNHDRRNITLFYSVARSEDIVLQPIFDAYGAQFPLLKSLYAPDADQPIDFQGKVSHRRLGAADIAPFITPESLVYMSGPEGMVEQLRHELTASGISSQQIIFDYFEGYTTL